MSGRPEKRIALKKEMDASLSGYKNPLLYVSSVLTWKRPIDFGVLLVLVSLGLWLVSIYDVTILTLFSSLLVLVSAASFALERSNFNIPWGTILPPDYAADEKYYDQVIILLVYIRSGFGEAWEDLKTFHAVNETRFTLQVVIVGSIVAYVGTYVSGYTVLITLLYLSLIAPGLVANSIFQRGFVIVEPYLQVFLDKVAEIKALVLAKFNERFASKSAAAAPSQSSSEDSSSASTTDDSHTKSE